MRPISLYSIFITALLVTMAANCPVRAQDKVVAVIDGQTISEADIRLAEIEWGAALENLSPSDRRRTLIAFLIESQLFAKAAVDERLLSKNEAADIERFNSRLGLRNFYFQKRVKEAVTAADAKKLYDAQVKTIPVEDEVRARHILVDTQQRAAELKKRIADGADFAVVAQKFSQDPTTNVWGGDLGYFLKGQMLAEIDQAAFSMKPGEISEPLKTQFGWHIIRIEDRRVRPIPGFVDLKEGITASLAQRKAQAVIAELRSRAKIEIRDPELATVLVTSEADNTADSSSKQISALSSPALVRKIDGEFATYNNRDLHGGDFRTLKNVDSQACSAACQANQQCKAYSFDRWNRWCFLKSSVSDLSFEPSSLSGVKKNLSEPAVSGAAVRMDRRIAKALSGPRSHNTTVASIDLCEETCRSDQKCVGYTFSKSNQVCKSFQDVETFSSEANVISGFKTQSPR